MLSRSKRVSFALAVLIVLAFASIAYALSTLIFDIEVSVTVVEKMEAEVYLDGKKMNSTTINVYDWGNVEPGSDTSKPLNIFNVGNVAFNVTLTYEALPSGWTLTYDKQGATVQPGQWLNGTLTLHVYAGESAGTKSFTIHVTLQQI